MHKNFSIILTSACLTLAATQAFAHNVVNEGWTGPYVGLSFGAGKGNAHASFSESSLDTEIEVGSPNTYIYTPSQRSGKLRGDVTGSIAELFAGYNYQPGYYPKWVFGGQLEGSFFSDITAPTNGQYATYTTSTSSSSGSASATNIIQNTQYTTIPNDLRSMFTILARGGYLVRPDLLIYLLGGGVEGNFVFPANDFFDSRNKWVLGYTVGTGLEYKLNNNWSFRGEYRYIDFKINRHYNTGSSTVNFQEGEGGGVLFNDPVSGRINTHFNYSMGSVAIVYGFC